MLVKIKPQDGYFNFTHDQIIEGELNDPEDHHTWDWHGGPDPENPRCRINGSPFLTAEEMGKVIRALVHHAKKHGCRGYEYVDLGR